MKRYLIALSLGIFGGHVLATEQFQVPTPEALGATSDPYSQHLIAYYIQGYQPNKIADTLAKPEMNKLKISFNDILRDIVFRLQYHRYNNGQLLTGISKMAVGLAVTAGSALYLWRSKKLTGASCYQLIKAHGIRVVPLTLAALWGGIMMGDAAERIAKYRLRRADGIFFTRGNFNGMAATLRQVKDSPRCYISDKDCAKHLLAQIRDLAPAAERQELEELIYAI